MSVSRSFVCVALAAAAAAAVLGWEGEPAIAQVARATRVDLAGTGGCAECHEDHAGEHRRSAHARAFTNALFQSEWRARGQSFCLPCPSPRTASPADEPELARAGVDCVTCHVRGDAILATRVSGRAPHASREEPSLASVRACESCHQIDAPHQPGVALQDTVAEWRRAGSAPSCQSCHMPEREGRSRHDLPGGHDPELLGRALTVDVSAHADAWGTRIDLALEANEVAHAVPTGDVFRRLVVRAWDPARPEDAPFRTLGRRLDGHGPGGDDRVPPPGQGTRLVSLRLDGHPREVRWVIELWSLPPARATGAGIPLAQIRRTVAEGTEAVGGSGAQDPLP